MRVLGLDWGTVRIGAAVSDPDGKIAFPLDKVIEAKGGPDNIKDLVLELGIEKIIIGLPKNLSGDKNPSTEKVERFVSELKKKVACDLELIDERFTSVEAGKRLSASGMNEQKQREVKDNIAAQIMLQQYLETKKS
jgi:putative holliday junction resolvase